MNIMNIVVNLDSLNIYSFFLLKKDVSQALLFLIWELNI
jgi:hypothetical protein